MTAAKMKQELDDAIEKHREESLEVADEILNHPELGFKEYHTKEVITQFFDRYRIPYTCNHAITGVAGKLRGNANKAHICLIGEMDAVNCVGHPYADLNTGAAHACGHHIQIANLLTVAAAFSTTGIMKELAGDLTFMAVPAEEFIDLEIRKELIRQNKIEFPSGKQQLIAEGTFDDIDIAMMLHAQAGEAGRKLFLGGSSLGFMEKEITFLGKEAHGSTPFDGVNALNAAMIALMSVNANRDTFPEKDRIRVHPIITNGGNAVNTVPGRAVIETYVRAANAEAIVQVAKKVDDCMKAGALALGTDVDIQNQAGYLPLMQDRELSEVIEANARCFMKRDDIQYGIDMVGSTDMGDLSHLIPCIQPTIGGFSGTIHGKDFYSCDQDFNVVTAAKILSFTIVDLLKNGAEQAIAIKKNFHPVFTKQQYLDYLKHSV
ncbi:MAG: amidohydrolase [Lachnospiraceae bacterium]|jgi:amidohydrolase